MAVSVAIRGGRRRGVRLALAALLALLGLALHGAAPAPAVAQADTAAPGAERGPRALIAFVPADPRGAERMLDELARRGFAVGLTSPTVGGYSPEQMALDMSQGARISGAAYRDLLDPLDLRPTGTGGRIDGWRLTVARARDAAGTVIPGLLATAIERAGGTTGYAGVRWPTGDLPPAARVGRGLRRSVAPTEPEQEAIVAADRSGRIEYVSLGAGDTLAERTLALLRRSSLVVTRLPFGARAWTTLDELLAGIRPGAFVYAIQAAPPEFELLPTGLRAPGIGSGELESGTTRREGLIAAPDVAPAVLRHLGVDPPREMQAGELESVPGTVDELTSLERRLVEVVPRRETALTWLLFAGLALVGAGALVGRGRGARAALRTAFLGALWLPALALLTAALRPSEAVEIAILAGGGIALGALTDRLLPWPAGPIAPAAAVVLSHTVDLTAGSPLVAVSLAGPNPIGGARFYGAGNELEIILSLTVLLGAGGGLALAHERHAHLLPRAFAVACVAAAAIVGAGRLGAAVGGVITLAAGGAAAVLASLPRRPSRGAVAIAVAAPVAGLALLAAIDIATAGGAHFTGQVLEGDDPGDLVDTLERRLDLSASGLERRGRAIAVAVAAGLLVAGVVLRRRLLAPLERTGPVRARAVRAGLLGGLVATVVGALVNDSGPVIFLIGTVLLVLAVAYVRAAPGAQDTASTTLTRCA